MDPALLRKAVDYARSHPTEEIPEDPGAYLRARFAGMPHQEIVGPTRPRGGVNGIILKDGYIVAEFGDTRRPDMTFSVTKSYLSTVAGLAWDEEWEGTLWVKPDLADRREGLDRELNAPGTFWEYNDVRVNLMAYCLLRLFSRPLPEVLEERVMGPIGASDSWEWHGYETSWTEIDGERVQSVSGGGHWGGGLHIGTRDHARFGLLFLRGGLWGEERLISGEWIDRALTPTDVASDYGYMWWLNTGRELFPAAPEDAFFALGAGSTNVVFVDPVHHVVTVTRWVDGSEHVNEFIRLVLASLRQDPAGSADGR
jgi:CubicO group peptidase (beta-lactamase class C family)